VSGVEAEGLRRLLAAAGQDWPAPIEHHPRLGSTNELLKERARAGAPEWSVVLAGEQTAGRGRQGRRWVSPPGNLYLSVLLRPPLPRASLLPLAAGLAVASILARLTVWYHALKEAGTSSLIGAWRARSVPWWGQIVEARSGGQVIRGVARDVDERGALVLDGEDGARLAVLSGDVEELRVAPVDTCS
jgi:BirA family biotin operon repressor/biotin-[acetyl-CoA-carboxylase] ligase